MRSFKEFLETQQLNEDWRDIFSGIRNVFRRKPQYDDEEDPLVVKKKEKPMSLQDQESYVNTRWEKGTLYQAMQVYNKLISGLNLNIKPYPNSQIIEIIQNTEAPIRWEREFKEAFLKHLEEIKNDKPGTAMYYLKTFISNAFDKLDIPEGQGYGEQSSKIRLLSRPQKVLPVKTDVERIKELVDMGKTFHEIRDELSDISPQKIGTILSKLRTNLKVYNPGKESQPKRNNILPFPEEPEKKPNKFKF